MVEPQPALRDRKLWQRRVRRLAVRADQRPVVFIVGSGLSWCSDGTGVWPVSKMVDEGQRLLRETLEADGEEVDPASLPTEYQPLMKALAQEDPELPNVLVRRAVLNACTDPEARDVGRLQGEPQRSACAQLQARRDVWRLPSGVQALARLIRWIEDERTKKAPSLSPPCIITTNFDGLMQLALKGMGVPHESETAILDARPRGVAHAVGIWHVHGNWLGTHTLHSQDALQAKRPELADVLARRFNGARVCVLGYGAWNDVVFSTITEVMGGRFDLPPEIVWSFFEPSDQEVWDKYPHVFSALGGVLADRVLFTRDVNVHVHLAEALSGPGPARVDDSGPASVGSEVHPGRELSSGGDGQADRSKYERLARELLEAAPAEERAALADALGLELTEPELCRLVAEICNILEDMPIGAARSSFAALGLATGCALSHLVLGTAAAPESAQRGARAPCGHEVETALLAELWMAYHQRREWCLVRALDGGERPPPVRGGERPEPSEPRLSSPYVAYDDRMDRCLEQGPEDQDWVAAFERRLWARLFPHRSYDADRERPALTAKLTSESQRRRTRSVLVPWDDSNAPWPAIEEYAKTNLPYVTFHHYAAPGTTSPPVNERTLANHLLELLELVPELCAREENTP